MCVLLWPSPGPPPICPAHPRPLTLVFLRTQFCPLYSSSSEHVLGESLTSSHGFPSIAICVQQPTPLLRARDPLLDPPLGCSGSTSNPTCPNSNSAFLSLLNLLILQRSLLYLIPVLLWEGSRSFHSLLGPWPEKGGHGKESNDGSVCQGMGRFRKPDEGCWNTLSQQGWKVSVPAGTGRGSIYRNSGRAIGEGHLTWTVLFSKGIRLLPTHSPPAMEAGEEIAPVTLLFHTLISSSCLLLAEPDRMPGGQGAWWKWSVAFTVQVAEQGRETWRMDEPGGTNRE